MSPITESFPAQDDPAKWDAWSDDPTPDEIHVRYWRYHPARPLDWRWLRAGQVIEQGRQPDPVWDDAPTHWAFALQQDPAVMCYAELASAKRAHQIHETNDQTRWKLESRLLAHRNINEAAAATRLPQRAVFAYERIFFNALDRIDCSHYIAGYAIKKPYVADPTDVATLWKFFGYWMGPDILDDVIADFRQNERTDYSYVMQAGGKDSERSPFGRMLDRFIRLHCTPMTESGYRSIAAMAFTLANLDKAAEQQPLVQDAESASFMGDCLDEVFAELQAKAYQEQLAQAS